MRMLISIAGLLLVLLVVGWLAKSQTAARGTPMPKTDSASDASITPTPRQVPQQYRQAIEDALQPPRPMPED